MEDVMVLCKKCGGKAPSSQMKLDPDVQMFICPECIKSKPVRKEVKSAAQGKDANSQPFEAAAKRKIEDTASKVSHKCSSCGFRFRVNVDAKTPKNCPYCNTRIYYNFI